MSGEEVRQRQRERKREGKNTQMRDGEGSNGSMNCYFHVQYKCAIKYEKYFKHCKKY